MKIFLKSFFEYKKNVYPIYKPAAVDYNVFNLGEFLSITNFVWRAFIKQSKPSMELKKSFWSGIAQYNYACLVLK
jgi:hypothetical protein